MYILGYIDISAKATVVIKRRRILHLKNEAVKLVGNSMVVNEEEKRRIIDLHFNQGKTIREVCKLMGKSSHDITPVTKERRIQLAQNYALVNGEQSDVVQREQDRVIPNVKAYKLFDEGKSPLEAAAELNLPGPQVQQYYVEYLNLRQMHKLIIIYQENKNRIGYFLKLFRLGKKESLTPERIIQLVKVADNIHKLQEKLQQLQSEIVDIEMKKSKDKEQLKTLQNEIEATQEKLNLVNKTFNMKYELKEACSQAQKLQNSVERFKEGQDYQELDRMELTPFTTTTIINYNSFLALRRPLPYPQGNEQLVGGRVLEMVERILYNLQNA